MLVTIEGKKGEERLITTSLKVAEVFEKQHKDVLEKIRFLSAEISANPKIEGYNPQFGGMGVSEILCQSNRESRHYAIFKVTYTKKFTQSLFLIILLL